MNCRVSFPILRRAARAGFTMVEIAIAIGVIGFALVAIIGILPAGLEVQRDNRSETILNQDATFWLEAIRSGAVEMNELANYVERISLIGPNGPGGLTTNVWHRQGRGPAPNFQTGAEIIGLLTWAVDAPDRMTVAQVTAISGSAAEKELDPAKRDLAFSYLMRVVIDPKRDPDGSEKDIGDTALPFAALSKDNGGSAQLDTLEHFGFPGGTSLSEIRITFFYPFVEGKFPPRSQTFRASVARQVVNDPVGSEFFYLRP